MITPQQLEMLLPLDCAWAEEQEGGTIRDGCVLSAYLPPASQFLTASLLKMSSNLRRTLTTVCFTGFIGSFFARFIVRQFEAPQGVLYGLDAIPEEWVLSLARHEDIETMFTAFAERLEGK